MKVSVNIDFEKIKQQYLQKAIEHFTKVGKQCIEEAQQNGAYKDQTGNLRNSIGFMVMLNGEVKAQKGISSLNKKVFDEISKQNQKDIVLIVVAGMNYAVFVEAKGYNVLSSAELKAENILKKLFK